MKNSSSFQKLKFKWRAGTKIIIRPIKHKAVYKMKLKNIKKITIHKTIPGKVIF